jgi:hypothetical protein
VFAVEEFDGSVCRAAWGEDGRVVAECPVIPGCISQGGTRNDWATEYSGNSHVRLVCPGKPPVTVSLHRTLDRGTLRSIIRADDFSVDELVALLD